MPAGSPSSSPGTGAIRGWGGTAPTAAAAASGTLSPSFPHGEETSSWPSLQSQPQVPETESAWGPPTAEQELRKPELGCFRRGFLDSLPECNPGIAVTTRTPGTRGYPVKRLELPLSSRAGNGWLLLIAAPSELRGAGEAGPGQCTEETPPHSLSEGRGSPHCGCQSLLRDGRQLGLDPPASERGERSQQECAPFPCASLPWAGPNRVPRSCGPGPGACHHRTLVQGL